MSVSPALVLALQALGFALGTLALGWVSRKPLALRRSHGFYRFFAWECILALVLLNLPVWHVYPFAPHQIASWLLLALSAWLPVHAVRLLRQHGQPTAQRADDPALFAFERTSTLVTRGAFRWIRHPMYTALMALAWGAALKQCHALNFGLALAATLLLVLTALRDEQECLRHFGAAYRDYMGRTRRFIPYLL